MVKCSWWKLFYYSHIENRKSFWERFNWVLTLKMDFESRKMPIFKGVASDHFTRYQKILWACLLGCKKLLNFICLPMKFQTVFTLVRGLIKYRMVHTLAGTFWPHGHNSSAKHLGIWYFVIIKGNFNKYLVKGMNNKCVNFYFLG